MRITQPKRDWQRVAEGVYREVLPGGAAGPFWERVSLDRGTAHVCNRMVQLKAETLHEAKMERLFNRQQYERVRRGEPGIESPYHQPLHTPTRIDLGTVFYSFADAGFPCRHRTKSSADTTFTYREAMRRLLSWSKWGPIAALNNAKLYAYADWRRESNKEQNGTAIALEVGLLRRALRWAVGRGLITYNPLANAEPVHLRTGGTSNCRDHMPESAAELHELADDMFKREATHVCGWQLLFEAFTGLRTSEALACRWDAKPGEAGFIDGDLLHVVRSKNGINPWVKIHPALRDLLGKLKLWHDREYPHNPCFFPSTFLLDKPATRSQLATALRRRFPDKRRTSHALRAYYVTVRRSEGLSDEQIAAEIGDVSGASIIAKVYGALPPNWKDTKLGKLTWLPEGREPAWACFAEAERIAALPEIPAPPSTPLKKFHARFSKTVFDKLEDKVHNASQQLVSSLEPI